MIFILYLTVLLTSKGKELNTTSLPAKRTQKIISIGSNAMKTKLAILSLNLLAILGFSIPANAVQIDFTGGTVVRNDGSTQTTNNSVTWDNVDYYLEGGFKLDFISDGGGGFESNIGNYYGAGNDVIHGHWETGRFGQLDQIKVTKLDNSAFDLNYFVLTSNTEFGGAPASGNERAFIHASIDGVTSSYSQLLPPEDWGFPARQIFLGSEFDGIKAFWFSVENAVDCFGMDNFFIDEPPPGQPKPVPESTSILGFLALGAFGATSALNRKIKLSKSA
jgi:hypothetical protein